MVMFKVYCHVCSLGHCYGYVQGVLSREPPRIVRRRRIVIEPNHLIQPIFIRNSNTLKLADASEASVK